MKKTLLVLAAGMGSRYGGLKQMDGFGPNGETILEYSVYDAYKAGFTDFVFVIRRAIEDDFKKVILNRFPNEISSKIAFQELEFLPEGYSVPEERVKPWGTGHAVWVSRDLVRSPFALVNGDDFYGRDSFQEMARYFDTNPQYTGKHAMVAYQVGNTLSPHGAVSRGLCSLNENGELIGLEEIHSIARKEKEIFGAGDEGAFAITEDAPVSMNLFGFYPEVFEAIDRELKLFLDTSGRELKSEFYIPSVVNGLIADSEASVDVLTTKAAWLGVTNPEDKTHVINGIQSLVRDGVYPSDLWSEF